MDFKKSLEVNGKKEELIFISWDGHNITHFIILGIDDPLFMQYNPGNNTWQFIGTVDDSLSVYESYFSDLIKAHLLQAKTN